MPFDLVYLTYEHFLLHHGMEESLILDLLMLLWYVLYISVGTTVQFKQLRTPFFVYCSMLQQIHFYPSHGYSIYY